MQNFNPLDPMNHSTYLENDYPYTINDVMTMYPDVPTANPNGPKLRPQPTQDSWYYSKDSADDGIISPFEKLKAFVKGGTYNMVRGMFCDKNGFSLGRTLATAAGIGAIALTGPIGMAVTGGVGLLAAVDNFRTSSKRAKQAVTDQQAREAFEGFGESAATAGLSLFGGFKALKAIRNNFAFAKANPNLNIKTKTKLMKWDISKLFKKPAPTPITPNNPPAPSNNGAPVAPNNPQVNPVQPAGPTYQPGANPTVINDNGYIPDWAPTGKMPKSPVVTTHEYIPDWKPTGNMPKMTQHEYFSPYEQIDPALVKPQAKPSAVVPEVVSDTAPIDPTLIKPNTPPQDFTYGTDNNHYFG